MSRKRKTPALSPWLSEKADGCDRRFIQVGNSLLLSDTFQALKPGARQLYLCMAMEAGGRRDFLFPQTAARKYGFAPRSFWSYVRELEEHGFILCRSMRSVRKPNEYRFSFVWKGIRSSPAAGNTDGYM